MDYRQEYEKWCNDPYFDEQTKAELKEMIRRSRIAFIVRWSLERQDYVE